MNKILLLLLVFIGLSCSENSNTSQSTPLSFREKLDLDFSENLDSLEIQKVKWYLMKRGFFFYDEDKSLYTRVDSNQTAAYWLQQAEKTPAYQEKCNSFLDKGDTLTVKGTITVEKIMLPDTSVRYTINLDNVNLDGMKELKLGIRLLDFECNGSTTHTIRQPFHGNPEDKKPISFIVSKDYFQAEYSRLRGKLSPRDWITFEDYVKYSRFRITIFSLL